MIGLVLFMEESGSGILDCALGPATVFADVFVTMAVLGAGGVGHLSAGSGFDAT